MPYRLRPEPLQEVDAWLAPFRRFWSAHVDALERHLRPHGSVNTNEEERQGEDDAAQTANVIRGETK